jgi:hypothetical protein
MLGGEPTYTRPLVVEHREPAELLEPTGGGEREKEKDRGVRFFSSPEQQYY